MARKKIEITNIGIDFPSYFQGFGTTFTEYEHAFTGVGNDASEAYDDAVEQLCMTLDPDDYNIPSRPRGIRKTDKVPAKMQKGEEPAQYYVGIRC